MRELSLRLTIAAASLSVVLQLATAIKRLDDELLWISVAVGVGLALSLIFSQLTLRISDRRLIHKNLTIIELKRQLMVFRKRGAPPTVPPEAT